MKAWRLDKWDFIIFGVWCLLVIWGVFAVAHKNAPEAEVIQFSIHEPSASIGERGI
jgi:hypothetical protein